MDVSDWLARQGLPQYAKAFAENAIDREVLEQLTGDDLKELGVALLGHRRKLLTAIQGLRSLQDADSLAGGKGSGTAQAGSSPERRHLTVLFCDLVGSSALATSLDPEDFGEVLRNYHAVVAEIVRAQNGFVAQYLGNGALVYFGYPTAHEHDAERAVRAALLLRDATRGISVKGLDLQLRAGLATGLVVVGDASEGSKASHEHRIMGETPNLAARLQALAEPGAIIIDAATRRLTGRLFNLAEREATSLKGFDKPVQSWTVLSEAPLESRFEALRSGETPLVGREEELELLSRRWQQVKAGNGRVVMISGEAGLGKSRLISAFEEQIKNDDAIELRYFCSPQHASTALHPVIAHLTRAADFAPSDTPGQKREKVGALAARPEDLPFIADLLSLPVGPEARLADLAPQEKRQKVFAALLARIEQLASKKPLFILFEDMHWVDPTTQEVVDLLITNFDRKSVLIVLTHRPQYRPQWAGQANVTSMSLNRLGSDDRVALIRSLIGNAGLSLELVEDIAERTDGIPLFVEELTKAVIESGDIGLLNTTPNAADHVPATLHASLMARLDHLGSEARETAQLGAVIGREFTYVLLKGLATESRVLPVEIIDRTLKSLVQSGIVLARGIPPASTFTFKHALVHDAAHSTLLRTQRQRLHAVLAAILSADDKVTPAILAYHYAEAGEHEKAARQWLKAAVRANEQSAVQEALQTLDQAVRLLLLLPKSQATETLQLEIEAERIVPTVMLAGFGSKEARAVLDRAESLAEQIGAEKPMLLISHRLTDSLARSDLKNALSLAFEFANRAEGELVLVSHRMLGNCYMSLGRLREALPHFEAVLAEEPARSAKLRFAYVYDPRAFSLINMALSLSLLGFPDQAERTRARAFELEKTLAHPITTAWVIAVGLAQAMLMDDRSTIEALSARLLQHTEKFKMTHFHRLARANIAYLTAFKGDPATGLTEIETCLSEWLALGYRYFLPIIWIIQIRVLLVEGENSNAVQAAEVGLAHVAETDEAIFAAELHRLQGVIALAGNREGKEHAAEQAFQTAIDLARSQDAKLLELRAATNLARLWREQGKHAEGEALLAPIYNWFKEGFATPDLCQAKALLEELSPRLHAAS